VEVHLELRAVVGQVERHQHHAQPVEPGAVELARALAQRLGIAERH
jgi:hypothetical protein